jgi:hypothetical protein
MAIAPPSLPLPFFAFRLMVGVRYAAERDQTLFELRKSLAPQI